MDFNVIAIIDSQMGISKNGQLFCKCSDNVNHFTKLTKGSNTSPNCVIMGNITYSTLSKPLDGRLNIILSKQHLENLNFVDLAQPLYANNFDSALAFCAKLKKNNQIHDVWVIGGGQVYTEAITHPCLQEMHITEFFSEDFGCDKSFPKINIAKYDFNLELQDYTYMLESEVFNKQVAVVVYRRKYEETQYLQILRKLQDQPLRPNRTAYYTHDLFAQNMQFSLHNESGEKVLPLLTTRRIFARGVIEELLWFISGDTNIKRLTDANIHIWDKNTSREFLDSRGLTDYPVGELGLGYGAQWRNFYGVDQLTQLISNIIKDPWSRRHVITAWNPSQLDKVALPPCHVMQIYYVEADKTELLIPRWLSCHIIMRSADMFHGVPFNIASYSLLTHMIALVCGLKAKKICISMTDCHYYEAHEEQIAEQLVKLPRLFPRLEINRRENIDSFCNSDFKIIDYYPHDKIAAEMVE